MALPKSLNNYTYAMLASYTYATINGTVYYSVEPIITGSTAGKISNKATKTTSYVTWKADVDVTQWEARATLVGQSSGVGVGLLVGSGSAVAANTVTQFDVINTELTLGDGSYKIAVYINVNGTWYGG